MKISWFHLMPYRWLPNDFRERYRSVWVDLPNGLYDPERGHALYNEYLDMLEYADQVGFDAVGVNEHHQNAYGMMPSPNLMAAALARRTRNAMLLVLGNSIALYNPPVRVAEEMAMLDVISGGRLIAGFPVGTSMDINYCYGIGVGNICLGRQVLKQSTSLTVSLTVTNDCQITSPDISFGTAPVVAGFSTVNSNVNVACTKGSHYTVGLDDGQNGAGGRRRMKSAANNFLAYDIFKSAGTVRWGKLNSARRASRVQTQGKLPSITISSRRSGRTGAGVIIGPEAEPSLKRNRRSV